MEKISNSYKHKSYTINTKNPTHKQTRNNLKTPTTATAKNFIAVSLQKYTKKKKNA